MVTVVSPHLLAAGAVWDDGPVAGGWVADRLGPFGPTVGHAVPLGYEAYAIVPIPSEDPPWANRAVVSTLEALVGVLDPFTGVQPVHFGMWDGWGWWIATGRGRRTDTAVGIFWSEEDDPPSQEELEEARAEGRDRFAAQDVECPDAEPLALPNRNYYLWTGPLRSATAFRQWPNHPPSLIWPEDRSWFVGTPIYSNEIAIAVTHDVIEAVMALPALDARRASPDDVLDIDD